MCVCREDFAFFVRSRLESRVSIAVVQHMPFGEDNNPDKLTV